MNFLFRYANDDNVGMKRHSYNSNRNQRFSRRNKDRLRAERHTVERERIAERSPRRFLTTTKNKFCFNFA